LVKSHYQVSQAGLELIMSFEGYREFAAQLPDGGWTLGYGHTKTARFGAQVTRADAKMLLLYDLTEINLAMGELIFTPLSQNQIDALSSFIFNVGQHAFQTSTVLRRVNEGALLEAACAIDLWRRAEIQGDQIIVDALVRRRAAEKALFLTPSSGWAPAPSPVVRARLDQDVWGAMPSSRPLAVHAPLVGELATAEIVHEPAPEAGSRLENASDAVSERLQAILPETETPDTPPEAVAPIAEASAPDLADAHFDPPAEPTAEAHAPALTEDAGAEPTDAPEPTPSPVAEAAPVLETAAATVLGGAVFAHGLAEAHPADPTPVTLETHDEAAELDEAPELFKPVQVSHDLMAEPQAHTSPIETEIAAPAPEAAAQPLAVDPLAEVAEPGVEAPNFYDRPAAEHSWTAETYRRPTLFPNLDAQLDPQSMFRTPAGARFSGFHVAEAEPPPRNLLPFLLLGLFGLVMFAGAAFWTFTARTSGGAVSPLLPGGLLALVGMGAVVVSVYYLVHSFLGQDV
jgi:lysozyme